MSQATRSYYEIALTNRQVLIAFSILLVCVICAFVSGLWLGQKAAARSYATTAAAEREPPSDTYRFFSPEKGTVASEQAGPPVAPPAPAVRPAPPPPAARQAAPPPQSLPPADAEPQLAAVAPPEPRAEPPAQRRAARREAEPPTQPEKVAREASPPPPPPPAPARMVDPPPTSDLAVIQVFSTPDEGQARAVLQRLVGGGFRAFLSPVQVDGRTMYRVRVGPFAERSVAQEEADKLKRLYKLDTWITN